MEEVTCLEFHPKEPILCSGSKDHNIKLFDISKASVKKSFKTITVSVQKIDYLKGRELFTFYRNPNL